jgi:4-hydroxy-3-methylbut-2-enyl diphosphate reductase
MDGKSNARLEDDAKKYHRHGFGLKKDVRPLLEESYASKLVDRLRLLGNRITRGGLTVKLAKEFGFCYGVEGAVNIAYQTRRRFPDKRIFITTEIIHNAYVNEQLADMGIHFLNGRYNRGESYDAVTADDVVILPAFGATVEEIEILKKKNCILVDTTCGAVMNVWRNVAKYAADSFTSVIHGKYSHEETRATAGRARGDGSAHYIIVRDMEEAGIVRDYIMGRGDREKFLRHFAPAVSPGFDPDRHLERIGLANQTTMLSSETLEIQDCLRQGIVARFGVSALEKRFRCVATVCTATQDRQNAVWEMMRETPDVMIVIGGYNSSNTTHLAEISQGRCPTYHIDDATCLVSAQEIRHKPVDKTEEVVSSPWLPNRAEIIVGVTGGASTPNNKIGETVERLFELRDESLSDLLSEE